MITSNEWAYIAALLLMSVQGMKLGQVKPSWLLWLFLLSVPFITWGISDFMSRQSIKNVESIVVEQLQIIQVLVLFEVLLLCFTRYTLAIVSFSLVLSYGQLLLLQSGYLMLPFAIQGVIYGTAISVFLFINLWISRDKTPWLKIHFFILLFFTYISASHFTHTQVSNIEINEVVLALMSFTCVICSGFVFQKIVTRNFK